MPTKGDITFNGTEEFTAEQMFKYIRETISKQTLNDTMTDACLKLLDKTEERFNQIKRSNLIYKDIIEFYASIATTKQKDQLNRKQMEMLLNG